MGAQGTTTVNFGAFPGSSDASVVITGQSGIGSGSLTEAWIYPIATADHTADEHWVENIQATAGNTVPGTGFTIYARNTNNLNEPTFGLPGELRDSPIDGVGGLGTRLYGLFTVAWVWN